MIRNKTPSSMQKTYDECYLICSTAIYFEGQGNEPEALRSWRSALDRIYYHNAYRVPANYRPQSETERALHESLRTMELQCRERVTLLEALRDSRKEADGDGSEDKKGKTTSPKDTRHKPEAGWIGNGSVPAASFADLVHAPLPPLPSRPAALPMRSPDPSGSRPQNVPGNVVDVRKPLTPNPPPAPKQVSRSPSPEKKSGKLKTTLRDGNKAKKSKPKAPEPRGQAASRAAGLAWDYKRAPASSTTPRNNSAADHRESLSEQDSGRRNSRESSRQQAFASPPPPAPPPHIHPPSISGSTPAELSASARPAYPRTSSHPDLMGSSFTSESPESRRKLSYEPPPPNFLQYRSEYPAPTPVSKASIAAAVNSPRNADPESPSLEAPSPRSPTDPQHSIQRRPVAKPAPPPSRRSRGSGKAAPTSSDSAGEGGATAPAKRAPKKKTKKPIRVASSGSSGAASSDAEPEGSLESDNWEERLAYVKKHLPKGIDAAAAKQIFNEIVVQGDEVHWSDIAGLDAAKKALKEAVVYPFLRPDLFMGLREPARGMLLFGPPGTGKTMLARAVATESRSTFFAISASSLTSKWLGDSEKLVRALFGLARALAPSIIFVDEIDSLLSSRGGSSEHESTRRIKTEFLIQWSDLQRAAAGKEANKSTEGGDPTRVLVLAATNMPWAIDDAARRRFVRRQYIPLPERAVRAEQLRTLLGHQKHELDIEDIEVLVRLTDGYSGSDITALAKDAAMGPLRSLGEALLHMARDEIRPIQFGDFEASLVNIRPSVSPQGLKQFEDWARDYGERCV